MRSYLDTVTTNPLLVVGEPGVTLTDRDNAVVYVTHRFGQSGSGGAHNGVWTGVRHRLRDGRVVHSHSSDRVDPR